LESNWRWNIADLGMTRAQFRLIARLVDPLGVFDLVGQVTPGAANWLLFRQTFMPSGAQSIQVGGSLPYEQVLELVYPD